MYKQILLNSIIKEMKIIRRLSTKIPADKLDFRKKEGMRSTLELLQYLSSCGTGTILYWYRTDGSDFKTFYAALNEKAKTVTLDNFATIMDSQIELITKLFDKITEEDLVTKEIDFPGGDKGILAQGIIETNIKWLTAYKMQLFLALKLTVEENLVTGDLWRKTEIEMA
ncbi:MAG: hypothetical protein ACXVPU_15580 [Bacteroidia bacterium]